MDELIIKKHNFENSINEIKNFSEQTITDLDLKKVNNQDFIGIPGGPGFGMDHKVSGWELNELTSQVQNHLCSMNNTQIKLIKEFGQVYSALDALDKDYIQAILASIKATEETSKSLLEAQNQIKQIVDNQRKTIEELIKFKNQMAGFSENQKGRLNKQPNSLINKMRLIYVILGGTAILSIIELVLIIIKLI